MKIGVIGGGRVGIGTAREPGGSRGTTSRSPTRETVAETAQGADVVVLALPAAAVADALAGESGSLAGKVVIDATNNISGGPSGLVIAALVPGARYVKAFNTVFATFMHDTPPNAGRPASTAATTRSQGSRRRS